MLGAFTDITNPHSESYYPHSIPYYIHFIDNGMVIESQKV